MNLEQYDKLLRRVCGNENEYVEVLQMMWAVAEQLDKTEYQRKIEIKRWLSNRGYSGKRLKLAMKYFENALKHVPLEL